MNVYAGIITTPCHIRDEAKERLGRDHHLSQATCIVMARSGAAARRAINEALGYEGVKTYRFNDYWSVTGNAEQIIAAQQAGEGVPLARLLNDWHAPYVTIKED